MDQRLMKLLQTAVFKDESCMLDTYNQSVQYDCSCTIRTNINTANHHFIMEKLIEPYNTDVDGNCFCLKANYYKMGGANFIGHTKDGFKATCVMEIVGNIYKGNKQAGRIYSKDGICPTLSAMEGGNTEPKIIEVRAIGRERTEEEKERRHLHGDKGAKFSGGKQMCFLSEISGCLTTSPTKDNLVGEIYDVNCNKENKMNNDTLNSVQKDNLVAEPLCIHQATNQGYIKFKGREIKDGDGLYLGTSDEFFRGGLSGISRTLKSENHDAGVVTNYRIRKLTPRECFRLMGVSETNIEKIQKSGVSQSQQYKMAGNSIVVDVLEHIFRKLFVNTGQESQQLSLF